MRHRRLTVRGLLVALTLLLTAAAAVVLTRLPDRTERTPVWLGQGERASVLCGIHAVFVASSLTGHDIRFEPLLDPRYVSHAEGSRFNDLLLALTEQNVPARSVEGGGIVDLLTLPKPLIVHVRADWDREKPDHYLVVERVDWQQAVIRDGLSEPQNMPTRELVRRWDGDAIVVGQPNVRGTRQAMLGWRIATVLLVGAALLALTKLTGSAVLAGMVIATLAGLSTARLLPGGLNESRLATWELDMLRAQSRIRHLTLEQTRALRDAGAILIDARSARAHTTSGIPGSVNVSIDDAEKDRSILFGRFDRDSKLIVYCGNEECGIADYLAQMLMAAGYRDVSVFPGGAEAWSRTP